MIDPDRVKSWLSDLETKIRTNTAEARTEIGELIGTLDATPVDQDGLKGLQLEGKPKIDGVLGIVTGVSNLNGSGEGI